MRKENKNINGFTLIELSIVLVIISLIVGGIIGGKSLIRSAQLRSVASDVSQIRTAINTFNLQYDAFPGDMRDASDYWPGCATPATNCNGNGDNIHSNHAERYRAWQHLYLAEVYPLNLTGEEDGSGNCVLGVNIPAASIDGTGFIFNIHNVSWWSTIFTSTLQFGSRDNLSASGCMDAKSVSAPEALSIDKKLDDGLASSGDTRATNSTESGSVGCLVDQGGADNNYDKSRSEPGCRMFFNMKVADKN